MLNLIKTQKCLTVPPCQDGVPVSFQLVLLNINIIYQHLMEEDEWIAEVLTLAITNNLL